MGMKEELVRTDEQNARYKQLVDANRQRKEFFEQNQRKKYSSISQVFHHLSYRSIFASLLVHHIKTSMFK